MPNIVTFVCAAICRWGRLSYVVTKERRDWRKTTRCNHGSLLRHSLFLYRKMCIWNVGKSVSGGCAGSSLFHCSQTRLRGWSLGERCSLGLGGGGVELWGLEDRCEWGLIGVRSVTAQSGEQQRGQRDSIALGCHRCRGWRGWLTSFHAVGEMSKDRFL